MTFLGGITIDRIPTKKAFSLNEMVKERPKTHRTLSKLRISEFVVPNRPRFNDSYLKCPAQQRGACDAGAATPKSDLAAAASRLKSMRTRGGAQSPTSFRAERF